MQSSSRVSGSREMEGARRGAAVSLLPHAPQDQSGARSEAGAGFGAAQLDPTRHLWRGRDHS